jgi:hypothetical protein
LQEEGTQPVPAVILKYEDINRTLGRTFEKGENLEKISLEKK